jgi:glycyl-tRNA synthetase
MIDAYEEEELEDGTSRTVMRLHPALAPYKLAVLPLSKKLSEGAQKVYAELSKYFMVDYDESGSIGKRYRRQDEVGTPFCITYDFDSEDDNSVTIRDRDTMEQQRLSIDEIKAYIEEKLQF